MTWQGDLTTEHMKLMTQVLEKTTWKNKWRATQPEINNQKGQTKDRTIQINDRPSENDSTTQMADRTTQIDDRTSKTHDRTSQIYDRTNQICDRTNQIQDRIIQNGPDIRAKALEWPKLTAANSNPVSAATMCRANFRIRQINARDLTLVLLENANCSPYNTKSTLIITPNQSQIMLKLLIPSHSGRRNKRYLRRINAVATRLNFALRLGTTSTTWAITFSAKNSNISPKGKNNAADNKSRTRQKTTRFCNPII